MARFNFTEITLNSKADITEVMNNFNKIEQNAALLTDLNTKAPNNHASTATTYGVASGTNYGHTKVINNITTGSYTDGQALSAYQGKVLADMIGNKVDKVTGKSLSTNDFTTAYKNKLDGIAAGANAYSLPTASSTLGGVKTTSTVSSNSGYTACPIISGVVYYKDTNTTYNNMGAATASAAGTAGLVPAPAAGKQASYLRGDGTWQVPTNTTYGNATTSASGLMSNTDKSKLDGIATGATRNVISTGSGTPSGGSNGDIYIQYF